MIESNFRSLFFNHTAKFNLDFCPQNAKNFTYFLNSTWIESQQKIIEMGPTT